MKSLIKQGRKSFVLISALLITSVSLLLLIPYVSRVLADLHLTSVVNNSNAAFDLAETGIERAIWEIRYNGKAADFAVPVSSLQSSSGEEIGEYEAAAVIASENAIITGFGYVPNKASYKVKKAVVITYSFHRAFGKGVAGGTGITMSGQADIDSYDSSLGPYNALLADGTYNKGQEGDIASNGPISIGNNSMVYGSANPGPGYPFSGTPNVTGSYGTLQVPLVIDPIVMPDNISTTGNVNTNITKSVVVDGVTTKVAYPLSNNQLDVQTGEIVNLPGGTYYFTQMNVQGTLNIEGPSTVYVVGDIEITGQGITNLTEKPENLLIFSTGDDIKIAGQGVFYGAVYAPQATVMYTGQADFYGSIVCGFNADKGQAALHYDKNLAKVMPGFVVNKVTSWQEI